MRFEQTRDDTRNKEEKIIAEEHLARERAARESKR